MTSILSWFQQATTGTGISTLAGTVVAMAVGQLSWQSAVPLLVGDVLAVVWPEKTGLQTDAEALVADALKTYSDIAARAATVVAKPQSKS